MDDPDALPGNRKTGAPKKVEVITTDAQPHTKSRLARFKEAFTGDSAQSVGSYILFEVFIPTFKDLIVNMVQESVRRLVLGEGPRGAYSSQSRQQVNTGHVSYNRYAQREQRPGNTWDRRQDEPRSRVSSFQQITVGHRAEAADILDTMTNLVDQYGQVSVADLYEMVGMQTSHTDHKYGWTNLREASVRLLTGGRYLIQLPEPVQL